MRLKGKLSFLPLLLMTYLFSSSVFCLPWTEDSSPRLNNIPPAYENVVKLLKAEKFAQAKMEASLLVGENPESFTAHLLLLLALLGNEEFSAIKAHLREVDNLVPQYSSALKENVFRVLFGERRYYRAMNVIAGLKDEQRSAQLDGLVARLYLAQSHYETAEAIFRQALQKDESLHDVRYDFGRALIAQGRYSLALTELRQIPAGSVQPDPLNQLLGVAYLSLGNYESALAHFNKILANKPNDILANLNVGLIQLVGGNYDAAVDSLRRSQKGDMTGDSIAAEIIALTRLEKVEETESLIKSLSAAQRADPVVLLAMVSSSKNNSPSKENLASIARLFPDANTLSAEEIGLFQEHSDSIAITSLLYKQGFYLAIDDAYKNANKETMHPFFVLNYARSLVKRNEIAKAITVYAKLGELHPSLISPKLELAEVFYHQKNIAEAIKIYRDATTNSKVKGLQADLLVQSGNLYNANNEPTKAIEQYSAAYKISPNAHVANQIAATYSEQLNQHDLAIETVRQVDGHDKFPAILDTLGWAYLSTGDVGKAILAYEKLLALTGNHLAPETFSRIAQVYEKSGNLEKSLVYYELALNTGHEFAGEHLAKARLAELDTKMTRS